MSSILVSMDFTVLVGKMLLEEHPTFVLWPPMDPTHTVMLGQSLLLFLDQTGVHSSVEWVYRVQASPPILGLHPGKVPM